MYIWICVQPIPPPVTFPKVFPKLESKASMSLFTGTWQKRPTSVCFELWKVLHKISLRWDWLYVCIHVCIYAYLYVCSYVCMCVCILWTKANQIRAAGVHKAKQKRDIDIQTHAHTPRGRQAVVIENTQHTSVERSTQLLIHRQRKVFWPRAVATELERKDKDSSHAICQNWRVTEPRTLTPACVCV